MSTPRLLPGPSNFADERREQDDRLQREVVDLRRQVRELDEEVRERDRRIQVLERAQATLQSALAPTFRGLQMVFGEFEKAGISSSTEDSPRTVGALESNFWETQKRRFPGKPSEIIDLLLERSMNTSQIATAGRMDPRTVTKTIYILNKAGLVEKNGGMFSLKQH